MAKREGIRSGICAKQQKMAHVGYGIRERSTGELNRTTNHDYLDVKLPPVQRKTFEATS